MSPDGIAYAPRTPRKMTARADDGTRNARAATAVTRSFRMDILLEVRSMGARAARRLPASISFSPVSSVAYIGADRRCACLATACTAPGHGLDARPARLDARGARARARARQAHRGRRSGADDEPGGVPGGDPRVPGRGGGKARAARPRARAAEQ